ncbi:MAG: helix-turn-helix transcriptional regulator, partial [Pseudomonas amygdali]
MMAFISTRPDKTWGNIALDVGERLQSIRKLKGLSQRELAKRAGVTNST